MKTQNTALRLGSGTGSLINHVISGMNSSKPEVGMGATILSWSDRYAATVVEVSKNGKEIAVTYDEATRTDNNGMSESQEYDFTSNMDGIKHYFTLRKNNQWIRKDESMKNGQRVMIGKRDHYFDYSF